MTFASLLFQQLPAMWSADKLPSLEGKVVIVTGASAGLGKITALELARKGAHVFCVGRSADKTGKVVDEIRAATGNAKVELLVADSMDLVSVEAAADEFLARGLALDILVNNAGIMHGEWLLSKQGIESQFATNHFATVVFTMRLLPALKKAASSRIVNLSSFAHIDAFADGIHYDDLNNKLVYLEDKRYGETKMANIHFTTSLQKHLEAAGVSSIFVNCLHPGVIRTDLFNRIDNSDFRDTDRAKFNRMVMISPEKGALTQIYVAAHPSIEKKQIRGRYFVPFAGTASVAQPTAAASDKMLAAKTWEWTQEILQKQYRSDWTWGL